MESAKKVRLGVWGCGGHAVHHLEHLPKDIELVALYDTNNEAMFRAHDHLHSPATNCWHADDLLGFPMDAVFIATPDQFHTEQIGQALEAGYHVLAEKPLAVTEEQFVDLKNAIGRARTEGLTLLTCHPRRFDPRNEWIRTSMPLLKSYLGEPKTISFTFDYPAPSDWKNSRGLLMDHVNHEIDLMGFLLGVADFSAKRYLDSPSEYHVMGSRVDGMSFSFFGTRSTRIPNWDKSEEFLRIEFERGAVVVGSHDPVIRLFPKGTSSGAAVECFIPPRGDHFERYRDVMQNFADVLRGTAEPYVSLKQMLVNTAAGVYLTTRGTYNSAVDGK